MSIFEIFKKFRIQEILLFLTTVLGLIFIRYNWISIENQEKENVLQIAKSIVTTLPKDNIKKLEVKPEDVQKPEYVAIKNTLKKIISINNNARFAYLYKILNDKVYFIADSEPEDSKDYSPPGQEYAEAKTEDKQPFIDGKESITGPTDDRWGTWVSVLIPVKDETSGKIIAVFGMDYDAKSWKNHISYNVIQSSLLVALLLIVLYISVKIKSKNVALKKEITVRENAEETLLENEKFLKIQRDTIASLAVNEAIINGDTESSKKILTEITSHTLNVARVSIWLLSEDGEEMKCTDLYESISKKHSEGTVLKAKDYPVYFKKLKESSQITAHDALNDPSTSEFTENYLKVLGISSMLDSALLSKDGILGVICFEHIGKIRHWLPYEESFANTMASMFVKTFSIADQKKAKEALLESQQRLSIFFNQSIYGYYCSTFDEPFEWNDSVNKDEILKTIADHQFITDINDAMLSQYCTDRESILNRPMSYFFRHDMENAREFRRKLFDQGHLHLETKELKDDGNPVWIEGDYKCVYNEKNRIIGTIGIQLDITERKKNEEAIYNSELQFKTLFMSMEDGFYISEIIYDDNGNPYDYRYIEVNPKFEQILGLSREQIIGKRFREIVPVDSTNWLDNYFIVARTGKPRLFEFYSEEYNMHFETYSYQTIKNQISVFVRDITERKRIENESQSYIRFLENMEKVNTAIQSSNNLEQMMNDVLESVSSIFDCDRIWLFYPCDPDSPNFKVPMEITKPEYPGAKSLNVDIPMPQDMARDLRIALNSTEPVTFIAGTEKSVNKLSAEKFGVKSMMLFAIYPKLGKPWAFGMHQCSHPRIWNDEEKKLFKEISYRISDRLSSFLFLNELLESERLLKETQTIARLGSFSWNIVTGKWSSSKIMDDIFGIDDNYCRTLEGWVNLIHPHWQDIMSEYVALEIIGNHQRFDKEYKIIRQSDRQECWVHGLAELVLDNNGNPLKLLGTISDITYRKNAEEDLKKSEEKLRDLIENMPMGYYRSTAEGYFVDINPAFVKMLGYSSKEELMEVYIPEALYFAKEDRTDFKIDNADFITETEMYRLKKKDGTEIWLEENARYIKNNTGKRIYHEGIVRDITESLHAQRSIIEAKQKAEEVSRLKTSFLANMSHEIRTPLNGILGFADILKKELKDPTLFKFADVIEKSGNRLLDTLDLILSFSKLEAEKTDVHYSNVKLEEIIDETLNSFDAMAKNKNLSLKQNIECENLVTYIDGRFLRQILNNLVNNAIKYTDNGEIIVSLSKDNSNVVIKVSDTGIGIAADKHKIIFEEFRQESEGHGRSFEGTGLGLAITKRFVELMKGTIEVESEPGVGSVFTVKFPYEVAPQSINIKMKNEETEKKIFIPPNDKDKKSVLLVENDSMNIDYTVEALKNYYYIEYAVDGQEAIEKAKTNIYDIILMDINLGKGMDGIETVAKIRELTEYKNTPIVALTAFTFQGDREEFISKGCSHYLGKPFTTNQILELLNNISGKISS